MRHNGSKSADIRALVKSKVAVCQLPVPDTYISKLVFGGLAGTNFLDSFRISVNVASVPVILMSSTCLAVLRLTFVSSTRLPSAQSSW